VEEEAFEKTMASYLRADQREVRVWDGRGCLQLRANGGNGASAWTWMKAEEEGPVDSSHDVAAGWEQVHGVRTVGSGPKVKTPDREAIAKGDHMQSLGPLWKGDESC
jgi:hypothetical protein